MMKARLAVLCLVLCLSAMITPVALAGSGSTPGSEVPIQGGNATSAVTSGSPSQQSRSDSYAAREETSRDLEPFAGGRQVIIATEYDVHILVGLLIVTTIILLVILL